MFTKQGLKYLLSCEVGRERCPAVSQKSITFHSSTNTMSRMVIKKAETKMKNKRNKEQRSRTKTKMNIERKK